MEFNEINALVDYYEERIKTNFDFHFNNLVIEDFYEGGGDVGRITDEEFYEEYFIQKENAIIYLLNEIGDYGEEFYGLQNRLIHLKRIIDNKMARVPKDEVDFDGVPQKVLLPNLKPSEIHNPFNRNRDDSFVINPKLNRNKFIETLFKSLKDYNFISTSKQKFITIFEDTFYPTNKIQWKGTELQITTLFSNLIDLGYFDVETNNYKYKLISTYFINKRGNDFRPKQLGSVYADKNVLIPADDSILKVIEEMSTHI